MTSAARQPTERPPAPRRTWENYESRIPRCKYREAAERSISNRLFRLSVALDHDAGTERDYATINNETLRRLLDKKSDASVSEMLGEGEKRGLWHRVMTCSEQIDPRTGKPRITGREGIVLLWRPSVLPVATAETLDASIARMRSDIARRRIRLFSPEPAKPASETTPEPVEIGTRFPGGSVPDFRGDRYQKSGAPPPLRGVLSQDEDTTTTLDRESETEPSSPPSLRLGKGIQSQEAQVRQNSETTKSTAAIDQAMLTSWLLALLAWPAAKANRAAQIVRELLAKARPAEKVLKLFEYAENYKAKGGVIGGAGWFFEITHCWQNLSLVECQEQVDEARPQPKLGAAPLKTPGQRWVEILEADGFRLTVLPDGKFVHKRVTGDKPLNMEAVAMLRGQYRESAIEFLESREKGRS